MQSKGPHLTIIGAILAAAAVLLLVFPAPARADEAVLVSNIDEQNANTVTLNFYKLAQGFTTAGAGTYDLGSIEVHIAIVPTGQLGSLVSASLRADDGTGKPDSTSLCALDIPSPWRSGIKRFGADNCALLTANTHYFVFLDYLQQNTNDSFTVRLTDSNNEDASSATNWLIDDEYRYVDENDLNAGWKTSPGKSAEIRVRAANTAPTASDNTVTTEEDEAYTFQQTDMQKDFPFSDADSSDTLDHVKITSLPGTDKGTLLLDGSTIAAIDLPKTVTSTQLRNSDLTYTPPANENGTPFTTFTFKVNDGFEDSASTYRMSITVDAVNDAPVISGPTTLSVAENTDPGVALGTYTATDQEGDSFDWSVAETLLEVDDSNEFSIVEDNVNPSTAYLFFTSLRNFEDPEDEGTNNVYEVRVEAYDGDYGGLEVTITVTDVEVAAEDDTATTDEDTEVVIDVMANDTDDPVEPDDPSTLSVSGVGTPTHGTVAITGTGTTTTVAYTPTADFHGTDTFTYTVSNVQGETATGTVTVTVNAVNDDPVATADTATTNKDQTVVIRVLENDTDVDGDTLTVTDVGTPVNGAGGITGTGTTITYTPTAGYIGEDNFFYEISDGTLTSRSRVTVTVTKNADLSALTITGGSLTPTFVPEATSYAVEVAHSVSSVTVTPIASDPIATVTVNGTLVNSGDSFEVALPAGTERSTITMAVTNEDYTKTYTIQILRPPPPDVTSPTVEIISEATGPISGTFEVTIRFSEPVQGFTAEDIQVRNGRVAEFTAVSSSEYRATIEPAAAGQPVVVEVAEDVAEDAVGNGNEAAEPFEVETKLVVSYAAVSYTATEGGESVTVAMTLSKAGDEELAIPVRVTRPATTEVGDYQVEGLKDWDAEAGAGTLTFGAGEPEQTFTIAANHDGDGDDETVELGFGELPENVMAGEPAVAIVTLEDKGLVELDVRFGQAAYEVQEGEAAEIKVTVSPAADRRVEVPLEVALQGGTTSEDYGGVPLSVVFESGESEGTISVEVLADEVHDPGEGIVLSLGALPEAVSAGDPASTEVHFGQRRTAEQFTSSLEAMLAVMGRSMGESAQTAIEGRFERHRQWSRLGSSGGAESTPQLGSANRTAALSAGESERVGSAGSGSGGAQGSLVEHAWGAAQTSVATGSDWSSEHRESGTPVSWLRNVVLGSFGNLARAAQSDSAISTGNGMAPGGSISGQDRLSGSGSGDARLGPGSGDFTGMRNHAPLPGAGTRDTGSAGYSAMLGQALNLSGASFEMSLGESEAETSWVPVLWGQGDLQQFNGDLTRLGMDYGGGLEAAHVGLDLYANDKVLAGLSFMRSWGDLEYTDDGVAGVLESRMNTVHPYVYWQPSGRLSVWGIGGMGQGYVEVEEPGRTHDFGADFRMFAGGVRAVLGGRGSNEWGVRADAFTTQLGTDALADIAAVRGEAQRGRLMLEWVHDAALSAGRSLRLTAEAGGRIDRGDADRGAGMETGFRLGYLDAHSGLDVALHGRVLVVHESDYRDWGAGVQASWDPGEKQRGFRASVHSSLGQDGGGRTTLWDNADAVMRPAGMGAMGMGSQSRMESEVAYAGLKAPGLPGRLTPYGRLRRAGQGRELALGAAWNLTTGSQLARPATFEFETIRRETSTGPADLALLAQMSIPF